MKWLLIAVAAVAALIVAVVVIGSLRPRNHVARVRGRLNANPDAVWQVLRGFETWAEWNSATQKVERTTDLNGKQVWLFHGRWGKMPMILDTDESPRRMRTVVGEGAGFSGSWTYEIEPQGDGCTLTLTEEGSVRNPVFRFMMMFHGNHATMLRFFTDLAARVGQPGVRAEIVHVDASQ